MSKKIVLTNVCAPFSFVYSSASLFTNSIIYDRGFSFIKTDKNGNIYAVTADGRNIVKITSETQVSFFNNPITLEQNQYITHITFDSTNNIIYFVIVNLNDQTQKVYGVDYNTSQKTAEYSSLVKINSILFNDANNSLYAIDSSGFNLLSGTSTVQLVLAASAGSLNNHDMVNGNSGGVIFYISGTYSISSGRDLIKFIVPSSNYFMSDPIYSTPLNADKAVGLSIDSSGYIYLIQSSSVNANIKIIDPSSSTVIRTVSIDPTIEPMYIAVNKMNGNIYFTGKNNILNRVSSTSMTISSLNPSISTGRLYSLASDQFGQIYSCDCDNQCVLLTTLSGNTRIFAPYLPELGGIIVAGTYIYASVYCLSSTTGSRIVRINASDGNYIVLPPSLNGARGLALDKTRTILYVAETSNNTICSIDLATGVRTLFAGQPGDAGGGYADGPLLTARFLVPIGLVTDSNGNIYISEYDGACIRKITISTGQVSTVAGISETYGSSDGQGTAARFNKTFDMAIDSADNLYVADYFNNSIRKITPSGLVSTSASNLNGPLGVCLDTAGNIYISEYDGACIKKINATPPASPTFGTYVYSNSIIRILTTSTGSFNGTSFTYTVSSSGKMNVLLSASTVTWNFTANIITKDYNLYRSGFYLKDINGGQCDDLYLGITSTGIVYYYITARNNASGCGNVYVYPWKSGVTSPTLNDFTLYLLYDATNGYYITSQSQMPSSSIPSWTASTAITSITSSGFNMTQSSKNMNYISSQVVLTTSQNFLSTLIGTSITSTTALPIKMFSVDITNYITGATTALPCSIYVMFYSTGRSVIYFFKQSSSTAFYSWAAASSDIMNQTDPANFNFQYKYNNAGYTNNPYIFGNSNIMVPTFSINNPAPTTITYRSTNTNTIIVNLGYLPNLMVPKTPLSSWGPTLTLSSTTTTPTFVSVTGNTFPKF